VICVVDFFPLLRMMFIRIREKKPPHFHQKSIYTTHENDTKTHINTLVVETCTRKKPEEHDGFII
jgi:hypothetical protein